MGRVLRWESVMHNSNVELACSEGNPPRTRSEAEIRIDQLVKDIQAIDIDLGDSEKRQRAAEENDGAYFRWRKKAVRAKNAKSDELRFLKRWIYTQRDNLVIQQGQIEPNNPSSVLRAACGLLLKLRREGFEFEPEELGLIKVIENATLNLTT